MTGDIIITLAGGMYQLTAGLMFNQSDSGQNGYQVIYRNAVGETAIISGGVPIMNWTLGTNGIWFTPSPVSDFRQLYVNGQRAVELVIFHIISTNGDGLVFNNWDIDFME